jgi:hypothetical protein
MLHITNGDATVKRLQQADLPGEIIAWNDVLHEGPVLADHTLEQLRDVRARFIASRGWAPYADVLADFAARDAALAEFRAHDEVVLWFEHDLYDQLQLIQLLNWFAAQDRAPTMLSLICIGEFAGMEPFYGLGQLTPEQLHTLFPGRHAVTEAELRLGSAAWRALCAPDPAAIEQLARGDTSALPFLAGALLRHLEQFPAAGSGLARTERQILEIVAAGTRQPIEMFLADQRMEERVFMGDTIFWSYVQGLCAEPAALLALADDSAFRLPQQCSTHAEFAAQTLALTEQGRAVLAGKLDWLSLHPIDRWLGGVHLQGQAAAYRRPH